MLKIVESVWAVGALSQSLLGELTAPPRALQLAAPPQNLRPRFSALRASFGSLPNSLHFPLQCLEVWIKHWFTPGHKLTPGSDASC